MTDSFLGWYLDREGTAPTPPDFSLVETERSFLEYLVEDRTERLLIRGPILCDWAFEVASARSIDLATAPNPTQLLSSRYSLLDETTAGELVARLGKDSWNESLLAEPRELLQRLAPEFGALWSRPASASHAADWLIWWVAEQDELYAIVRVYGESLAEMMSSSFLQRCYTVGTTDNAMKLLSEWIGIVPTHDQLPEWQDTYLSTTQEASAEVRRRLLKRLQEILTRDGLEASQRMLLTIRDSWLKSKFADDIALYLRNHSEQLSERAINQLAPFLEPEALHPLRAMLPVPAPVELPAFPEEIAQWYEQQYRPWLMWSLAHARDNETHQRIGAAFSERYLELFQHVLNADGVNERIAWQRAAALRNISQVKDASSATLLLVLDGVGPTDIDELIRACGERIPSLRTTSVDWVLVAPPSATPFTKPTIVAGKPSTDAGESSADFRGLKSTAQIIEALRTQSFVTWSLDEPDKSYHQSAMAQDLADVQYLVSARLRTIASILERIVSELGQGFRLQLVVTSDHGRLLLNANRTEAAPGGLMTHGRSAWGVPTTPKSFSSAYERDGSLIWLNPSAFFLPEDQQYVVRTDTLAFTPANNARGLEAYPHGGLFPEEVIVPWVTMETQVEAPEISVSARGSGVTGSMGELTVSITNQSRYTVVLEHIQLEDGTTVHSPVNATLRLGPFQRADHRVVIESWPQDESIKINTIFRLPSGESYVKTVSAQLETRALYRQNDPLADLEF